ncbi:ABC transporter permease protein YesQ [Thermoclostridium stercorarium subsp. stercorarium DSM 8532]|jgi:multiple sugar transport system permease protein|uniref:ABC transporter permease protein YesQ n=3 Tax=Thermoclostridium stercorarium TaxID=1510 RepID=L7VNZ2_THES1|nr:carbohydrate ABC transporter permease [Thermoclostridium stercorarium]AGC67258.1 ABC transporter permease protein YesQ [Thermoclostridium stercorarium subsp. stercorarium DSM 8532]AGI38327.1 ABC transporter permease subunit [Thermoclostridium stercorarium subsp. stercorarium DSM 8532]ANW97763.1 ABC transporter permease [Thermoclostridium stercorarium subsp. thermolacticum DSM 2910]ANX00290.1 ABC transporter permease [Thermoclostridium stercorarium subsp. leptospartum DSM 9219]UZQ85834.1 car
MSYRTKKIIGKILFHVLVTLSCILMIYPLLYMVFGSFKTQQDIFQNPTSLFPKEWYFRNYINGWKGFGGTTFATFFKNSIIITVIAVIGQVTSSAIIAYGFGRCRFKGRSVWFSVMIVMMLMPAQVLIIPQYIMFNSFGWVNTWLPLVVPGFFGYPFFIFLIYQFIRRIPVELDESAYIDGCSKYSIFGRIILPLIKPALITAMIFATYWKWDDFFGPMIYLTDIDKYTISVALKMFTDPSAQSDWGAAYAMSVLSLVPVIIIFFSFQKYLVEGISTTGIKG